MNKQRKTKAARTIILLEVVSKLNNSLYNCYIRMHNAYY